MSLFEIRRLAILSAFADRFGLVRAQSGLAAPMSWRRARRPTLRTWAIALLVASCMGGENGKWVDLKSETPSGDPTFRIVGTVHYVDVEGGVFVIRDDQGTQYHPLNLPKAFQVEGTKVEADARRRDDMASIGMVGPLVELQRIRQRPADGASH